MYHRVHIELPAYMEMFSINWILRLDSFPQRSATPITELATEHSYLVCTMIHCLRETCSCCISTWCVLVVNLLTEIPYMVCQTIHSLSLHFAIGPQMSFLLAQVEASPWFSVKPVPSPVIVPQKPKRLGAWLLRLSITS